MKLSIILVNYNTVNLTRQCLQSIYNYLNCMDYEVILVDNSSSDGSVECIKNEFPNVIIIANQTNLGFGKANNQAFKIAKGEYVFLLNTDTIIVDNSIQKLVLFLDEHKEISIVGGQLLDLNRKPTHSYSMAFPSIWWEIRLLIYPILSLFKWYYNYKIQKKGYLEVAYITGADMMLRRENLEAIGYFDEDFFMYFEETDLSYRFAKNKYRSVYYPNAEIIHLEGASFTFREKRERLYYASRKLYYEKHHTKFYSNIANMIHTIVLHILYIIGVIFRLKTKNIYLQRIKLFKDYK